jgi:Anticodon binding domain
MGAATTTDTAAPPKLSASARRARRRAAKAAAAAAPIDPAEAERRARQAAVRELALKVRAQGQQFNKWKARRAVENRRTSGRSGGRAPQQPAATAPPTPVAEAKDQTNTPQPGPTNDTVLVLPIFWNKRPAEKAAILAAAASAAATLRAAGVTVTVDDDDAASPGKKMERADAAGIRVRVEIGPKDLTPGTAAVAVAAGDGGVAPRTPVRDRKRALVVAVKRALGVEVEEGEGDDDAPSSSSEGSPPPPTTPAAAAVDASAAPITGEGLDDDFGDVGGVESDGGGKKRKKKKKW